LRQSGVTLLCRGVVSLVYRVETEVFDQKRQID